MSAPHFLPEGSEAVARNETVLWEGRPQTIGLARHLFQLRAILGYFAVLACWNLASAHADGFRADAALISALWVVLPGTIAALVIFAMSWVYAMTTHYTITDRRVIMQIGVALPIALTLPLTSIVSADVRLNADGSGDIPLRTGRQKLAYLLIWPHARPWRFKSSEPMLRAIPNVAAVAGLLSQALLTANPSGEAITIEPTRAPEPRSQPATATA